MMLACYSTVAIDAIPIIVITPDEIETYLKQQTQEVKNWFQATQFRAEPGTMRLVPNAQGNIAFVLCCVADKNNFWEAGAFSTLPEGVYQFENCPQYAAFAIAWGLGAYQFTRYKKASKNPAQLYLPAEIVESTLRIVEAIYLVRDLINTPTDDMGPTELADAAATLAKSFGASCTQIVGHDLLVENFAAIHTVGRASDDAPRLVDIRWGDPTHPKVTLVGKGVCFDTGGLDLKSANYMTLMKKDMGGAANALGLARMIMSAKLPIALRVLIPMVENAVAGNAYRPGDVIKSRKGTTIEIGNTDAEGRLILADALTAALEEKPELLIDIATLTGAARVAVGPEIAAVFANNDAVVNEVLQMSVQENDPIWRLPLYKPYREYISSPIADLNNCSVEPNGGAITAALFLQDFVPNDVAWLHFDMNAWNNRARPGRPQGGEAMAIRALFSYLQKRFPA